MSEWDSVRIELDGTSAMRQARSMTTYPEFELSDIKKAFFEGRINLAQFKDVIYQNIDAVQEAFVNEDISINEFVGILNDGFGHVQARQILKKNLKLARRAEYIRLQSKERNTQNNTL